MSKKPRTGGLRAWAEEMGLLNESAPAKMVPGAALPPPRHQGLYPPALPEPIQVMATARTEYRLRAQWAHNGILMWHADFRPRNTKTWWWMMQLGTDLDYAEERLSNRLHELGAI